MTPRTITGPGLLTSVAASVGFGALSFMSPLMAPIGPFNAWAFRTFTFIPVVLIVLWASRQLGQIAEVWHIMRQTPVKFLGMVLAGLLVAFQLGIFMWAPMAGHGLGLALGYFLLPLVLVVQGRLFYRDELRWWHWIAVALAGVGVVSKIAVTGGISWETFAVAFGYSPYFALRRAMGTENVGGMLWEQIVVLPIALATVAITALTTDVFATHPHTIPIALGVTAWGGGAMVCYILASRLLPLSIFGLLTYLEPALLTVVALLLGETIAPAEAPGFVLVWIAVLTVLVGGIIQVTKRRRKPTVSPPPAGLQP